MPRNEHQTRIELIYPALFARGWTDAHLREEKTPGSVDVIDGKPCKRKGRTDYLLCLPIHLGKPPLAVGVLEAKAEDNLASLGIQQARNYGRRFNTPFVFSTNGHLFAEFAKDTGHIRDALPLAQFSTPDELRPRYETRKNISLTSPAAPPLFMPYKGGELARWYFQDAAIRAVVERLADYDPATLNLAPAPTQDLLKKLYHRLVSPHIRKALGEYYTPDWLAQRVLNMLDGGQFRGDPDVRLLDPTCGSGTFRVMAINAIRRNSIAQSLAPGELLRKICHNIVGIDLNPLAVIAARTNYLLALGPLLAHRGKEPLEIPIYLADSVTTPSRSDAESLFEQDKVHVCLREADKTLKVVAGTRLQHRCRAGTPPLCAGRKRPHGTASTMLFLTPRPNCRLVDR